MKEQENRTEGWDDLKENQGEFLQIKWTVIKNKGPTMRKFNTTEPPRPVHLTQTPWSAPANCLRQARRVSGIMGPSLQDGRSSGESSARARTGCCDAPPTLSDTISTESARAGGKAGAGLGIFRLPVC